ncbi:uncharacterized protein LOC135822970 [Sycon ciliatum]|uniref:uncharacterized protein LOC135822970 n=1 Tax=Sycon ciliatum TaxID=27933 RepID=UPI0031F6E30A
MAARPIQNKCGKFVACQLVSVWLVALFVILVRSHRLLTFRRQIDRELGLSTVYHSNTQTHSHPAEEKERSRQRRLNPQVIHIQQSVLPGPPAEHPLGSVVVLLCNISHSLPVDSQWFTRQMGVDGSMETINPVLEARYSHPYIIPESSESTVLAAINITITNADTLFIYKCVVNPGNGLPWKFNTEGFQLDIGAVPDPSPATSPTTATAATQTTSGAISSQTASMSMSSTSSPNDTLVTENRDEASTQKNLLLIAYAGGPVFVVACTVFFIHQYRKSHNADTEADHNSWSVRSHFRIGNQVSGQNMREQTSEQPLAAIDGKRTMPRYKRPKASTPKSRSTGNVAKQDDPKHVKSDDADDYLCDPIEKHAGFTDLSELGTAPRQLCYEAPSRPHTQSPASMTHGWSKHGARTGGENHTATVAAASPRTARRDTTATVSGISTATRAGMAGRWSGCFTPSRISKQDVTAAGWDEHDTTSNVSSEPYCESNELPAQQVSYETSVEHLPDWTVVTEPAHEASDFPSAIDMAGSNPVAGTISQESVPSADDTESKQRAGHQPYEPESAIYDEVEAMYGKLKANEKVVTLSEFKRPNVTFDEQVGASSTTGGKAWTTAPPKRRTSMSQKLRSKMRRLPERMIDEQALNASLLVTPTPSMRGAMPNSLSRRQSNLTICSRAGEDLTAASGARSRSQSFSPNAATPNPAYRSVTPSCDEFSSRQRSRTFSHEVETDGENPEDDNAIPILLPVYQEVPEELHF